MHIEIQNCFSFWGTLSPDPLPGLRPWTPLEDCCPPDPLHRTSPTFCTRFTPLLRIHGEFCQQTSLHVTLVCRLSSPTRCCCPHSCRKSHVCLSNQWTGQWRYWTDVRCMKTASAWNTRPRHIRQTSCAVTSRLDFWHEGSHFYQLLQTSHEDTCLSSTEVTKNYFY